jgi:hypothetical protein
MADDRTYTQAEVDELLGGIRAKNDDLLKEVKRTSAALKAWDGKDPAKYDQLVAAADEAGRKKAAAEGDFKSLETQMRERHAAELGQRDTRISTLTAALERRLVEADAAAAIAEARGSVKGLLPHARPHLKVVEIDGEFVAQVVDAKGNPRIADGKGTPLAIKDLVEEMRGDPELARLFEGTGSSGSGAVRSGGVVTQGTVPADGASFMANIAKIRTGEVKIAGMP